MKDNHTSIDKANLAPICNTIMMNKGRIVFRVKYMDQEYGI